MDDEVDASEQRVESAMLEPSPGEDEGAGEAAEDIPVESLLVPTMVSSSPGLPQVSSAPVGIVVSSPSPEASAKVSLRPSGGGSLSLKEVEQQPPPKAMPTSLAVPVPGSRKPSQQPSGGAASRIGSYVTSLKASSSVATRPSTAVLAVPPPHYAPLSGPRSPRSPRSRSIMSMSIGTAASRRSSRISTFSKQAQLDLGLGLSPGLRQLISRLADTKDVSLIAYLSAVPGEPQRSSRMPPPTRLVTKQSMRPMKSIMKMTRNQVRFEATYRLEPLRPFNVDRVWTLLHTALETGLSDATYSDQWAGDACRILAAYITNSIKSMDFSRYKIATKVTVIERNYQGVQTVLRALWDADRDRYCSAHVQTSSLIGMAVVFAVYWE